MKLSRVEVKGLFGVFKHDIKINNDRGITIIIGENGLGKTAILEMIEAFFNNNFQYFSTVLFTEFVFEFVDGIMWTIKKDTSEEQYDSLIVEEKGSKHKPFIISRYDYNYERERTRRRLIETKVRKKIIYSKEYMDMYGEEHYFDNIINSVGWSLENAPEWFIDRFEAVNVNLIETQRVFVLDKPDKGPIETVQKYSTEIVQRIKSKLAESTELSAKLDRTYPNRLINELKQRKGVITDEQLNEKLNQLEEKRGIMDKVGLLETDKDSNFLKIDKPQEVVKDVLMLYIKDSFEKLSVFDELSSKIELLLKIINFRFKHKKLYVNKEKGFLLKSTVIKDENGNQKDIPIEKLSSGEKNELILFYRLIFKTKTNSLILIDEPEISLHISWQNKFISDLNEIHKLNKLDILIATHSPDIISNNWDLKVELKGVE